MDLSLAMFGAVLALLPYSLVRKRWTLLAVLVPVLFMLSIGVMCGIEKPNPENVIFVPVATLGE